RGHRQSCERQRRGESDNIFHDFGVWRSLVAHLLWEQGVGGSNPLTPTIPRLAGGRAVHGRRRVFLAAHDAARPRGLEEETSMASVKKVSYFKMMVPNRPGQ